MHLMSATSSLAINEVCPMIAAIGIGMSLQPPLILLQAAMPLGDMAASASSFMLVRSLGATTGISIAGSVLATRQQALLAGVQDYTFVGVPSTRAEYDAMQNLQPESLRLQVLGAFADSFQVCPPSNALDLHEFALIRSSCWYICRPSSPSSLASWARA